MQVCVHVHVPLQVIVMTDWQKFIPTDIIQNYLPWVVLEQYLKPDILTLLKPEPAAVPKPGQPIHKEPQRAITGWQQLLPASVIKQYIPEQVLAKYVPEGVVLATDKDQVGAYKPTANATATIPAPATIPATAPTGTTPPAGPASKPQEAPKGPPSFVAAAAAASSIFAAPMKEPYEAGPKQRAPVSRHLMAASSAPLAEDQQGAVFFREEPAQLRAAQAHTSTTTRKALVSEAAAVLNAQPHAAKATRRQQQEQGAKPGAATHAAVVKEQGALDRLFGGLSDKLRDDHDRRGHDRYGYAPNAPQQPLVTQQQPSYPVVQPTPVYPSTPAAGYSNPVGHVPAQQQQPSSYYVQQPYPPQQQQQQPMTGPPNQYGQLPQALPPQPPGYQPTAAVPLPTSQQPAGQAAQQAAGQVLPQGPAPQQQQQLPAGMQDCLEAHNYYRARHQAPAVVWDDQLATSALGVASACLNGPSGTQGIGENLAWGFRDAGTGVDECERTHTRVPARSWQTLHCGNRCAGGCSCVTFATHAMRLAGSQQPPGSLVLSRLIACLWAPSCDAVLRHLVHAGYKEGKQYDFNNPGFTMTSGHFSQIVWAETQRLGCALVATCSMPTLICHYFPPGVCLWSEISPSLSLRVCLCRQPRLDAKVDTHYSVGGSRILN